MADILAKLGLDKLERALLYGVVLAVVLAVLTGSLEMSHAWGAFFLRWTHVLSGVMWIGLLWYFNFVQIPSMPKIPDEQKPAVSKVIAPTALFWFRWAAAATVATVSGTSISTSPAPLRRAAIAARAGAPAIPAEPPTTTTRP